jgi:hypothetical protein
MSGGVTNLEISTLGAWSRRATNSPRASSSPRFRVATRPRLRSLRRAGGAGPRTPERMHRSGRCCSLDDEELEVVERLGQDALHRLAQELPAVVDRQENGDPRRRHCRDQASARRAWTVK